MFCFETRNIGNLSIKNWYRLGFATINLDISVTTNCAKHDILLGRSYMKQQLIEAGYGPPSCVVDDVGDENEDDENDNDVNVSLGWSELIEIDGTNTGNPFPSKSKCDKLLDPNSGVTDLNWGLDSLMSAFLKPVGCVIKHLQTVGQPIGHRLSRELRKMRRQILAFQDLDKESDHNDYPKPYNAWRKSKPLCV